MPSIVIVLLFFLSLTTVHARPFSFSLFEFQLLEYQNNNGQNKLIGKVLLPCSNSNATDWGVVFENKTSDSNYELIWATAMSSCDLTPTFQEFQIPIDLHSDIEVIKNRTIDIKQLIMAKRSEVLILNPTSFKNRQDTTLFQFSVPCEDRSIGQYINTKYTYDDSGDREVVVGHVYFNKACKSPVPSGQMVNVLRQNELFFEDFYSMEWN